MSLSYLNEFFIYDIVLNLTFWNHHPVYFFKTMYIGQVRKLALQNHFEMNTLYTVLWLCINSVYLLSTLYIMQTLCNGLICRYYTKGIALYVDTIPMNNLFYTSKLLPSKSRCPWLTERQANIPISYRAAVTAKKIHVHQPTIKKKTKKCFDIGMFV